MTNPANISDRQRVGILWALMLLVFAAFNAVYWPVHARHQREQPEYFVAMAQALHRHGDFDGAIKTLRNGVRTLRPPCALPYALLEQWLREAGLDRTAEAERARCTRAFYEVSDAPAKERAEKFRAAARYADAHDPVRARPKSMQRAAALLAGTLGAAVDVGSAGLALTYGEQLALLRAAGGAINDAGLVDGTRAASPVNILVQSGGGEGVRRQAHIIVEGRDWAKAERGFHVALIDAATGQVMNASGFDVWDDEDEAARMTEALNGAPAGTIGAFAVYDDASGNITPELERALEEFGCAREALLQHQRVLLGPRYSFAAIGAKGAAPGTALQAWSPDAFTLPQDGRARVGHPVVCGVLRAQGGAK